MSYLDEGTLNPDEFAPLQALKKEYGFLPRFFGAQGLRPDLIEAEITLIDASLIKPGALSRRHKEYIFLVCSAANLSTYCVSAHCEIVRMLGLDGPEPEQIALNYLDAGLPMADTALLNYASKLNDNPTKISLKDIDTLRRYGFSDPQILEAVVLVGLVKFANYVSFGLGAEPDFETTKLAFLNERELRLGPSAPHSAD